MTPTSILTEIRQSIVGDDAGTRWTDATLRGYMYAGELEIVKRHPESQYGTRVLNSVPTLLAGNGDSFTITDAFRAAIVHYTLFRVFGEDSDGDQNSQLAGNHYKLFLASMGDAA